MPGDFEITRKMCLSMHMHAVQVLVQNLLVRSSYMFLFAHLLFIALMTLLSISPAAPGADEPVEVVDEAIHGDRNSTG